MKYINPQRWACPDCQKDADGNCEQKRAAEKRNKIAAAIRAIAERLA